MSSLPLGVLSRCFVRSLFLQAAWNVRGMQNLGFAYAIWPALEMLYPDPGDRRAAAQRHLELFNTQPYMAEAVLGGAIHHEERIARGELPPESVVAFKRALAGPLAALGDTFFWAGLRPATGALGALLMVFLGVWALPVFLVLYNAVHVWARLHLFRSGLQDGEGVLTTVAAMHLAERATWLKYIAAAAVGLTTVAWAASQAVALGYSLPWTAVAVAGAAAVLILPFRAGISPYLAAGLALALGWVAGIVAGIGQP